MTSIYKKFAQAVVDLTFRLLPSEGSMPWAIEFPPQNVHDLHSSLSKPSKTKMHYKTIEPMHDEDTEKLLDELESDIDELEELDELGKSMFEEDGDDDLEDDVDEMDSDDWGDDDLSDEEWDEIADLVV